jgi:carbon monoxide dehydrogenase subunit G
MVEVTRTFTVSQPTHLVLGYLQDFGNAEEWDPGTVSCTRLDAGPVRVGSRWRNVSEFLGRKTELAYELTQLHDDRVVFTGRNKTATSTDDIAVLPGDTPGTSTITYHATITFNGLAKLAAPVARIAFEKLANGTVTGLTNALRDVSRT